MARLKPKQIREMKEEEKKKKIQELKFELAKSKASQGQGSSKTKEIKKTIARLLTIK